VIGRFLAKRRFEAAVQAAASALDSQGAPVEAALELALAEGRRAFGDDAPELAFVLYALASRALEGGRHDEALRHATALQRIVGASGGKPIEPDAAKSAALVAAVLERSKAPASALEEALADWAKAAADAGDRQAAGDAENQLGLALGRRGEREAARAHFDEAVSHRRAAHGAHAVPTLEALYNRATFRDATQSLDDAKRDLEQVVAGLSGSTKARERDLLESCLHNLGVLAEEQGDSLAAAEQLGRSLELREERLGREHASLRPTLVRLAQLNHREQRLVHALALYERALAIAKAELPAEHPIVVALEAWRAELTQGIGPLALKRN
jgi:tetratricopeptide (TPR) repeat protein